MTFIILQKISASHKCHGFYKILGSTTVYNIDNNKKKNLEPQINILELFLKNHLLLKTRLMTAENSSLPSGLLYIFKQIKIGLLF